MKGSQKTLAMTESPMKDGQGVIYSHGSKNKGFQEAVDTLTKTAALALVEKHLNPPVEETETEGVEE